MPSVTLHAPAKLNLALSVGPPEPAGSAHAGWHPIASWMAPVDLCDEVAVEVLAPGASSVFTICFADDAPRAEPVSWPLERDLAFRAHKGLEARAGRPLPSRVSITKRIPTASGLGGGSSDAASTLIALNIAHDLNLPCDALAEIGRTLGSDVSFFIDGPCVARDRAWPRPALVGGFGERIERLEPVSGEVVLIIPSVGCATPDVYRAYDTLGPLPLRERQVRALATEHALDPVSLFNDLAAPARAVAPELNRIVAHAAQASGFHAHITGSGSAIFILTPPERGHALARRLTDDPMLRGCAVIPTWFCR